MRALIQRVSSAEVWIPSVSLSPAIDIASSLAATTPTSPCTPSLAEKAALRSLPRDHRVGHIGPGLCAFIGIADGDDMEDVRYIAKKLLSFRVFESEGKPWHGCLETCSELSLLLVSQFTLHAGTKKAKPDFHASMTGERSLPLFDSLVALCRESLGHDRVATGQFGAMMDVKIVNDGPVTIMLDSWNKDGKATKPGVRSSSATIEETETAPTTTLR